MNQPLMQTNADPAEGSNIVPLPKSGNLVEPDRTCHNSKTTSPAIRTEPKYPVHVMRYKGRSWRLFKRSLAADATWHVVFHRAGIREPHTLRTSSITHAEAEARALIDRWLAGFLRPNRNASACTIGEIVRVVELLPIAASLKCRADYVWSLRWVLRLALGVDKDERDGRDVSIDGLRVDVLCKDTARRFFSAVTVRANGLDQGQRNTWLRTATTLWANSLALFAPRPLDALRNTFNLRIPSLEDWRKGRKLFLTEKVASGSDFERPDDATIRRTFVEWMRLARMPGYVLPTALRHGPALSDVDRRNMFVAVGLALSCGLRASEFRKARWSWFTVEKGRPLLSAGDVKVKNKSGQLRVRPLNPFWIILNRTVDRMGWRGAPEEYCLVSREQVQIVGRSNAFTRGGQCDRTYWASYLVGKWLRWLGWRTQKTNHALRDLSASYVTMKFGLTRAKLFCRHGQQATTEAHYGRFVDEDTMDDSRALRWLTWA